MALRAAKPDPQKRRLKCGMFGPAKVGKSTACCQFPKAYIIDSEHGTEHDQYAERIIAAGSQVYQCPDIGECIKEVTALRTEQHDYQTLVIDSLTILYQDECDRQEKRVGTEWQKHRTEAQKPLRRLWALINQLDMNVICTFHAKNEWKDGKSTGHQALDCWDKLEYRFDLIFELFRDKKNKSLRQAKVAYTRLREFPEDSVFPWSYEEVVKRYPAAGSGLPAQAIKAAEPADVERLKGLIAKFNIQPATVDKWLAKAEVETLEDMPADKLTKCIEHLLAV